MPKGYLVANIRVNDTEVFKKFSQTALPIIEQYGGKILARGPHADRHEGNVAGVVTISNLRAKKQQKRFILVNIIKLQRQFATLDAIPI